MKTTTKETQTKCFSCGARMTTGEKYLAHTMDGQKVHVGEECHGKIQASRSEGYQPIKGGPRLWVGWEHHWDCGHIQHTPAFISGDPDGDTYPVYEHNGDQTLCCATTLEGQSFIVRAVNSHEALLKAAMGALEALEHVTNYTGDETSVADIEIKNLREAIRQAEGK